MYSFEYKQVIINLYHELKINKIIGEERIKIIMKITNNKFSISSLYNWLKKINHIKRKYINFKITNDIEKFIILKLNENKFITTKQIKILVKDKFNVELSKTSIYNIYKKNNFTFKRNRIITNAYSKEEQIKQIKIVSDKIKTNDIKNIISIDEMSITLNSKPYYGWTIKGTRCETQNNNKIVENKRYSLLMATCNNKIINYSIVLESIKSLKFKQFIEKIHKNKNNNTYFMDNAIIHKSKLFTKYINEKQIKIIYNVPYHSEFNPIECVFSMLRNEILKNKTNTLENVIKSINNFKINIESNKLNNIFNHSIELLHNYK